MSQAKLAFHNPAALFNPTPYGFCHTVTAPLPQGSLVFIAGQSGGEGLTHELDADFRRQVQVALTNLQLALQAHQLGFADVAKITILIVDHNQEKLQIWSEEMQKCWAEAPLPASTLIPVPKLALAGMQIEVDAIAYKVVASAATLVNWF